MIVPTQGTIDDHLADVKKVFDRLIAAGFAVRCDKVHLAMREVPYLGVLCAREGTRPQPEKTKAILDQICEDMQFDPSAAARYVGMLRYYSKFIPNLSSVLAPFDELKQKGANAREIMMSLRFKASFAVSKELLLKATSLARPDFTKPFYIDVDAASSVGAGAVLSQRAVDSDPHSHRCIAFWSKRFSPEERRYGVRDQEFLGLIEALENWRPFICGYRTIVRTDHSSLQWLLTTRHPDASRASGYAFRASGYDIEVQYVPGVKHTAADFMSRSAPEWGERERGKLDNRAHILERVTDAVEGRDSYTTTCNYISIRDSQRAYAVFTSVRNGNRHVLVERQGAHVSLPSVPLTAQKGTTRSQLACYFTSVYDKPEKACHALRKSVRRKYRNNEEKAIYFICSSDTYLELAMTDGNTVVEYVTIDEFNSAVGQAIERSVVRRAFVTIAHIEAQISDASAAHREEYGDAFVPRLADAPEGPALIDTPEDAVTASRRLSARLRDGNDRCMAIDLEGHHLGAQGTTSLVQVTVDALLEGEQPLIYVFDTFVCGRAILGTHGPDTLRSILEDPKIDKVLHCCYGDAAALYFEYGIKMDGIFDTAVADAVALSRHANKPRGLLACLHDWVGAHLATMTHKGVLVHEDRMWEARPLTFRLFVYAYEDVKYSTLLYLRLRSYLEGRGLLELVYSLSQKRAPPISLTARHCEYLPPDRVAIALLDDKGKVVCRQSEDGVLSLPSGPLAVEDSPLDKSKAAAKKMWADVMGAPPNLFNVKAAINARLRKAVRIGNTLLYTAVIGDCAQALCPLLWATLAATDSQFEGTLAAKDCFDPVSPARGVDATQVCLFQHLSLERSRSKSTTPPIVDTFSVGDDACDACPSTFLRVQTALATSAEGRVRLQIWPMLRSTSEPATAHSFSAQESLSHTRMAVKDATPQGGAHVLTRVTVGYGGRVLLRLNATTRLASPYSAIAGEPSTLPSDSASYAARAEPSSSKVDSKPKRVAVILHDDTHVYALQAKDKSYAFPYHPIEAGTDLCDCAAKALDNYAGVSLRKLPSMDGTHDMAATPLASVLVRRAEQSAVALGNIDDTIYYSWHVCKDDHASYPLFAVGTQTSVLCDFGSSFYASRRQCQGFQMVATKEKAHPGFDICDTAYAKERLSVKDQAALELAIARVLTQPAPASRHDSPHDGRFALPTTSPSDGACTHAAAAAADLALGHVGTRDADGEWDFKEHRADCFPALQTDKPVYVVYHRPPGGQWQEWVMIADSTLLRVARAHPGYGVYALRGFRGGTSVGHYGGRIVATGRTREEAQRAAQPLVRAGSNSLLVMRQPSSEGYCVVDGASDPVAPFLYRMNDARGTSFKNNCAFLDTGRVRTTCLIPPLDVERSLLEQPLSELRVSYGKSYWAVAQKLGTSELPLECYHAERVVNSAELIEHALSWADRASPLPAIGEDSEFDNLFTASVLVNFAMGTSGKHRPVEEPTPEESASATDTATAVTDVKPPELTRSSIVAHQLAHPSTLQIIERLRLGRIDEESSSARDAELSRYYLAEDGVLMRQAEDASDGLGRIVAPPAVQHLVCILYHDHGAHLGVNKILPLIRRRFHWGSLKEMRATLSAHIRACGPCTRVKLPHHRAGELHMPDNGRCPNDTLTGDVYEVGMEYEGWSHTLDFVCNFTRRVTSTATRGMPTSEVIATTLIDKIMCRNGKPRVIRSDHGSNFISQAIEQLYDRMRIRIDAADAYRHQFVGVVERWHATLKQLVLTQKAMGHDDNWPSRLALLELAYNSTIHAVTKMSPFFVDCMREAVLPWDAMISEPGAEEASLPEWVQAKLADMRIVYDAQLRALRTQSLHAKQRFDLKRDVATAFKPGDRVMLIRGEILDRKPFNKTALPTDGPFGISHRLPHDRYVLKDLHNRRIHNIVHVSRLILCGDKPFEGTHWMLNAHETGGKWPVHSIVGRRRASSTHKHKADSNHPQDVEYKIRWLGLGVEYDSWRHLRYLDSIGHLVSLYNAQHGFAPPPLALEPTVGDEPAPRQSEQARNKHSFRYFSTVNPPEGAPPEPRELPGVDLPQLELPLSTEPASPEEPLAPAPALEEPDAALPPSGLGDNQPPALDDIFPLGSRVEVYVDHLSRRVEGVVDRSWVTRPRIPGAIPTRKISVAYRNAPTRSEHTLPDSNVRLLHLDSVAAPPDAVPVDDASPEEEQRRKRVERQLRQLQISP